MERIKRFLTGARVAALVFVLAQLFQPERTNPPADPAASFAAVANPAPEVAAILERACHGCHSHRTVWPWYSRISPVSWMMARDVNEGRARLNFSRWNIYSPEMTGIKMREICRQVKAGEMPLWYYLPAHPEARLSPRDIEVLCAAAQ